MQAIAVEPFSFCIILWLQPFVFLPDCFHWSCCKYASQSWRPHSYGTYLPACPCVCLPTCCLSACLCVYLSAWFSQTLPKTSFQHATRPVFLSLRKHCAPANSMSAVRFVTSNFGEETAAENTSRDTEKLWNFSALKTAVRFMKSNSCWLATSIFE